MNKRNSFMLLLIFFISNFVIMSILQSGNTQTVQEDCNCITIILNFDNDNDNEIQQDFGTPGFEFLAIVIAFSIMIVVRRKRK